MNTHVNRVVFIVLDSVGFGEMPDAHLYGDQGSDTLRNTAKAVGGLKIPFFESLGLGNAAEKFGELLLGVGPANTPRGAFGRLAEKSAGKDTTTGHWELAGIVTKQPFPTFPQGFPAALIAQYEEAIGTKIIGNRSASGTEIIAELGEEHMKTGYPIVYTSADSVFQVAAHEDIIPIEGLYNICEIAREMLQGEHGVGRVIARPFRGVPGSFVRTEKRKDFSLEPSQKTLLDYLKAAGKDVIGIGKIEDIFAGKGLTQVQHTGNNRAGIEATQKFIQEENQGLIMTNLVDFDMLYGHRNDPHGYANSLTEADQLIGEMSKHLREDDVVVITADHGCDPTTPSTDHSREYVPVLIYGKAIKENIFLGTRQSFADLGATVAELLGVETEMTGLSFAKDILKSQE